MRWCPSRSTDAITAIGWPSLTSGLTADRECLDLENVFAVHRGRRSRRSRVDLPAATVLLLRRPGCQRAGPMNCERTGPRGDERLDHAAGVLGLRSGHAVDHQAFLLLEAAHRALGLRAVATVNGDMMTVGDQLLLQRLDVGAVGADVALAQIGHGRGSGGTGLRRSGLGGSGLGRDDSRGDAGLAPACGRRGGRAATTDVLDADRPRTGPALGLELLGGLGLDREAVGAGHPAVAESLPGL